MVSNKKSTKINLNTCAYKVYMKYLPGSKRKDFYFGSQEHMYNGNIPHALKKLRINIIAGLRRRYEYCMLIENATGAVLEVHHPTYGQMSLEEWELKKKELTQKKNISDWKMGVQVLLKNNFGALLLHEEKIKKYPINHYVRGRDEFESFEKITNILERHQYRSLFSRCNVYLGKMEYGHFDTNLKFTASAVLLESKLSSLFKKI